MAEEEDPEGWTAPLDPERADRFVWKEGDTVALPSVREQLALFDDELAELVASTPADEIGKD